MKNPDALRIFFPECFGGKYKPLKKRNSRRIIYTSYLFFTPEKEIAP
jgi:hypothetical protein